MHFLLNQVYVNVQNILIYWARNVSGVVGWGTVLFDDDVGVADWTAVHHDARPVAPVVAAPWVHSVRPGRHLGAASHPHN